LNTPSIYLDTNATTTLHPRVLEGMEQLLADHELGNPSSLHGAGRRSRKLIEEARENLAALLDVDTLEIFFTSGGTESNNIAITSLAPRFRSLWVSSVEHSSVREPARALWKEGFPGGEIAVDERGQIGEIPPKEDLDGALVSIQWVNNETGAIQDLRRLCTELSEQGAVVHSDGAQGFFRLGDTIPQLGVDAATITAHKSFGPQGVGALWMRRGIIARPLFTGGSQERKVRPGTENLVAIHGLGILARIAREEPLWPSDSLTRKSTLVRNQLGEIAGARILSPVESCFPNCINVTFEGVIAETLLVRLDLEGIFASSGSACSSGAREPSHVLRALGCADSEVRGAIRLSFAPDTTDDALLRATSRISAIVRDLRSCHVDRR